MFKHTNSNRRLRETIQLATGVEAAFTIIEMLVVVGVIALLAGIMLGAMPAITEKKIHSRINVEMAGLQTAIESYKAAKGYYPPDNTNNVAQPPLFYELTGTVIPDPANPTYRSVYDPANTLTPTEINTAFRTDGFLNSDPQANQVKNFYPNLKPSAVAANGTGPKLLVVPYSGPQGSFNPWRYNSSHVTNNVGEYDLWAEVLIRGKKQIISNWKQ